RLASAAPPPKSEKWSPSSPTCGTGSADMGPDTNHAAGSRTPNQRVVRAVLWHACRLGAGGVLREIRRMSILGFVDSVGRDLRYALRGLSRRPAFTFTAVLTLAVGIGAATAIFSVVYSVLIKPLPYPNPDELVSLKAAAPGVNIDDLGSDQTMLLT